MTSEKDKLNSRDFERERKMMFANETRLLSFSLSLSRSSGKEAKLGPKMSKANNINIMTLFLNFTIY